MEKYEFTRKSVQFNSQILIFTINNKGEGGEKRWKNR